MFQNSIQRIYIKHFLCLNAGTGGDTRIKKGIILPSSGKSVSPKASHVTNRDSIQSKMI